MSDDSVMYGSVGETLSICGMPPRAIANVAMALYALILPSDLPSWFARTKPSFRSMRYGVGSHNTWRLVPPASHRRALSTNARTVLAYRC